MEEYEITIDLQCPHSVIRSRGLSVFEMLDLPETEALEEKQEAGSLTTEGMIHTEA
jgi:hypothetical protein